MTTIICDPPFEPVAQRIAELAALSKFEVDRQFAFSASDVRDPVVITLGPSDSGTPFERIVHSDGRVTIFAPHPLLLDDEWWHKRLHVEQAASFWRFVLRPKTQTCWRHSRYRGACDWCRDLAAEYQRSRRPLRHEMSGENAYTHPRPDVVDGRCPYITDDDADAVCDGADRTMYVKGCREKLCVEANRDYQREYMLGRPRTTGGTFTERVTVPMTPEMRESLQALARERDVPLGAFIREVLCGTVEAAQPRETPEAEGEL